RGNGLGHLYAGAVFVDADGLQSLDAFATGDPRQNVRLLAVALRRNEHVNRFANGFLSGIPNNFAAPGFQVVMMPSSVLPTMASCVVLTMAASRACDSSARLRSVMSARMATYCRGLPSSLRNGTMVVSTQ